MESQKRCNIGIEVKKSPGGNGDGEEDVFTSGSVISGFVTITAAHTIVVAAVDISFAGITTIALDSMGVFRSSKHQFLALKMPPLDHHLPPNGVLTPGATIAIPYNFTVPHRLSISACIHNKYSHCFPLDTNTIEKHTRPPPSSGSWGRDNNIPGRPRISYDIRAEVARRVLAPEASDTIVERAERPVSVLPALPEDPPLDLSAWGHRDGVSQYNVGKDGVCLCSTRKVHGSRFSFGFKRCVGTITARVKQPRAVRLTSDGDGALGSCAHVRFEFLSFKAGAAPPKISVKSGKMLSTTAYTWTDSKLQPRNEQSAHRTYTNHSVHPIMYVAPENVQWINLGLEQVRGETLACCPSSASSGPTHMSTSITIHDHGDDSSLQGAAAAATADTYTTTLEIPFTLLKKGPGFHVPTFHSCLISCAYALQLTFAIGAAKSTLSLAVPLQVSVQVNNEPDVAEPGPPSFCSVVVEDDDRNEQPGNGYGNENTIRVHTMSREEMQLCSGVLPPEYDSG